HEAFRDRAAGEVVGLLALVGELLRFRGLERTIEVRILLDTLSKDPALLNRARLDRGVERQLQHSRSWFLGLGVDEAVADPQSPVEHLLGWHHPGFQDGIPAATQEFDRLPAVIGIPVMHYKSSGGRGLPVQVALNA